MEPELEAWVGEFGARLNFNKSQTIRYILKRAADHDALQAAITEEVSTIQLRLTRRVMSIRAGLIELLTAEIDEALPEHLLRPEAREQVEAVPVELPALPARGEDIVEGEVEEMQGLGGRRRKRRR